MERNQIKELLTINRTTFPNFYKAMTETDLTILVNTWHALFKNLDAEVVQNAFAVALAKAEFPVVPANVFAVLNAQSKAKLPTTDELFDMADKAARAISKFYSRDSGWTHWENGIGCGKGYPCDDVMKIYNALPPILREWRHSPMDLLRWWWAFDYENESYARHDFKEIVGDRMNRREALGIGYSDDFRPTFDVLTGLMKSIEGDKAKQIGGGNNEN